MSLYKRGSTWYVRFTAPNGKRIQQPARTEDKRQAQEYEARLIAEMWRIHMLGEKPRRTWRETVVRWLSDTEHKADHSKDIDKLRWLEPFLGSCYLDEIDRDLIDHIGRTKKAESSPSTANRYLAVIRAILRMARDDWEWVDRVPRIRLYPEPKRRVRYLTRAEAASLISALPTHLADMAEFSLATGLRQSNVSGLTWDQVDLERGTAWIHADQSKNRRAIAVPLNSDAVRVLRRREQRHESYVFTYRGKPVRRCSTKAWYAALRRCGIEDFRWHDLRHTWASWHIQSGTTLQELMELGGWSSQAMVLRYAHLSSDHLRHIAGNIEGTGSNVVPPNPKGRLRLVVSR